jgi:predicted component of type VI protein secretion system
VEASLVLVNPDGKTQDVPVKGSKIVIGRDTGCGIRIPSSAVSRQHCEITIADGLLTIKDLGSSNGTYVNRVLIRDKNLMPGDVVSVGPATFVVRIDGEPQKIDTASALARGGIGTSMDAPPAPSKPAAKPAAKPTPKPGPGTGVAAAAAVGAGATAKKPKNPDDSDDFDLGNIGADDSSVFDFDFKDDDNAPKL